MFGLVWIVIGKMFVNIQANNIKESTKTIAIVISILLLYIEYFIIKMFNLSYANDCYILLLAVCPLIFYKAINLDITLKNSKLLRKFSTISYCMHASVARVLNKIIAMLNIALPFQSTLLFLIVIFICIGTTYCISKLEDKKYLKFLKYSY